MKTSVSIPDLLFEQAEELAIELKKSRSQLYTEAIRDLVVRFDPDKITEQLDRAYGGEEQDTAIADAVAREGFSKIEW